MGAGHLIPTLLLDMSVVEMYLLQVLAPQLEMFLLDIKSPM
jgi:hypothetical protein